MSSVNITLDFETRSACNLPKAGAYAYSTHPTTSVMCACWHFLGDPIDNVYAWQAGFPHIGIDQSEFPQELADRVAAGEILEAHNAFFEWCIWNNVWRKTLPKLPELKLDQIRCSAAKAAAFALPRALDKAISALDLPQKKDMEGAAIMKKLAKPRKPTAAEKKQLKAEGKNPDNIILWLEDRDMILRNTVYCQQDVRAEHGLSSVLRDLTPRELQFWQMDLRMNLRGIHCDIELVHIALELAEAETDRLNGELQDLTDGRVQKTTGRIKFKQWMADNGSPIPNTQGATLDILLGHNSDDEEATAELKAELQGIVLNDKTRRACEIVRDGNRSSLAKYRQMLIQLSEGNRLRDMMLYCGASRTGRWSGKGVQPHNFIRGYSETMEEVCNDILRADPEMLTMLYGGSVLEVLSKATRGALIASIGKKLMVADFAAIEARVLLWLANAIDALQVFYRGEDIYLNMATSIFAYPCTNKDDFPFERRVGKAAILGLGFQMGWEKFEDECRNKNGITDQPPQFFKEVVRVYRKEKFPEVSSFWYDLEEAAILAVKKYDPKKSARGPVIECRRLKWFMWGQFLHMELPSGRLLSYFRPLIKMRKSLQFPAINERGHECSVMVSGPADMTTEQGRKKARHLAKVANKKLVPNGEPNEFKSETLTFMHENPKTRRWERKETYGGELAENGTQATARDLIAEAMYRVDQHPDYDLLLSVHDEEIAEIDEELVRDEKKAVYDFERMMEELPIWAKGCPVDAEGWMGNRYRK